MMAPTYTMGLHDVDTSTKWTTSDVMCYFVRHASCLIAPACSTCLSVYCLLLRTYLAATHIFM